MIDPITAFEMRAGYTRALRYIAARAPLTPRQMIARFAEERCVTVDDLTGADRHRPLVWHRQDCQAMLHKHGMHPDRIGGLFNRDRSTVLHSIKAAERRKGN